MKIQTYLQKAKELEIIPNFWLSEEYLQAQPNVRAESDGSFIWIREGDWVLFPPLQLPRHKTISLDDCPPMKVWSDFANYAVGDPLDFLDWEYTYQADDFKQMNGGHWSSFRRNSRKWPRRNPDWVYTSDQPSVSDEEVETLLIKWLRGKEKEEIQDHESMLYFLFHGNQRDFILKGDKLVGINVWDVSANHLIFRYCVTDPDEPFLQEFARLQFYLSVPGHAVIDGGTLDSKGLEQFKDKMNPVLKRRVYSRIIE